jgi:hypothetical protein
MAAMLTLVIGLGPSAHAQAPPGAGGPAGLGAAPAAVDAREQAPFDPTGYWVALVTSDWRYRMVVPPPGYWAGIPLTLAAKQFADTWDRTRDEAAGKQCEAYGGAVIMRVPTRLHVAWQDANTLTVQTDAGTQTRTLYFKPTAEQAAAPPSLQGYSVARWSIDAPAFGFGFGLASATTKPPPRYGTLKVSTTHLTGGLLRTNGIPYGDRASVEEQWNLYPEPTGEQWLTVSLEISDPVYLREAYIVTANFQKQADNNGWDPSPCTLRE